MFRMLVALALIVAAMAVIKDGRALEETGLLSTCEAVLAPAGQAGFWEACSPGRLEGRPDLARRSCVSQGVAEKIEYWRCPSAIESGPSG